MSSDTVSANLFRAYDIRGVADRDLTPAAAYQIAQAWVAELQAQASDAPLLVALGQDTRLSSPRLAAALQAGLLAAGADVVDLGTVPTPVLYFAVQQGIAPHGVMVTGSHNPPEHNGFKLVSHGQALYGAAIQTLYQRIQQQAFPDQVTPGKCYQHAILADYVSFITQHVQLARPLRVAIDCGNGVGGVVAESLFRALGCEVYPLYCEPDGHFPNHSPDPTQPESLRDLQALVQAQQLDIGLAVDGDADRLIAVDGAGTILWPDRLLMLFVRELLPQYAGRCVVYDVKCSHHLAPLIRAAGGEAVLCATGHSLLKKAVQQHNAVLGGEFSGHLVLRDQGVNYDDGLYAGARLLALLARLPDTPHAVFASLPSSVSTPELKLNFPDYQAAQAFMQRWQANPHLQAIRLITVDGLRAEYAGGWGLVRASNTSASLTLRFEADNTAELQRIQGYFRAELQRLGWQAALPF